MRTIIIDAIMALMYRALFAGVAELPLTLNRWLQVPTLSAEVERLRRSIRHDQVYRKSLEDQVLALREEIQRLRSEYSIAFREYDRHKARFPHYRSRIYVKI